jgi:arylsulfatase A-like enzyme
VLDDLLPTLLSVAGLTRAEALPRGIDGVDLSSLLSGGVSAHADRPIYIHYPHQWYRDVGVGLGIQPFTAMRRGSWKLIYFYGDGYKDGQGTDPWFELYDLEQDVGEEADLAQTRPEVVHTMAREMHDWMVEVDAQTPVSKATNKPVPLPQPES